MNGQAYGCEWPIHADGETFSTTVLSPEEQSLDERFNNKYVNAAIARCEVKGLLLATKVLGRHVESIAPCMCPSPSAYVLFTTYLTLVSPIRCMDCFGPVALYRMKAMDGDEYCELISWQSNYQSCDTLQMNCHVLERAATREMSNIESILSKSGLEYCQTLAASNDRPFYYYLYRYRGRSLRTELERRCPGCGNEWRQTPRLHDLFDFKCDRCHLLSNIALDLRWLLGSSSQPTQG
ncbi:DUF2310 family Zn-ribbon-containing protein [Dyella sp. LX-66]|nr:DUF2310 family Zn-ribbon-containing protein [Dyella sp. LX-1]MBT2141477.1 DUF2310 family Zn-ribbon-containing protein [Dyella sp. LX-66]